MKRKEKVDKCLACPSYVKGVCETAKQPSTPAIRKLCHQNGWDMRWTMRSTGTASTGAWAVYLEKK